MPKQKKKGRGGGKGASASRPMPPQVSEVARDEDDDQSSVVSVDSMGNASVAESVPEAAEEEGGLSSAETKLLDFIDLSCEKGAGSRVKGLEGIRRLLQQRVFLFDEDWSHTQTLCDALERSLKRGKAEEQVLAAQDYLLFLLQHADNALVESDRAAEVVSLTRVLLTDPSAPTAVRCACASGMALLLFLRPRVAVAELDSHMRVLEDIFRASFLKGDRSVPKLTPAAADVHLAALKAWLLLLTAAHRSQFRRLHDQVLVRLPEVLHSGCVDLRIAAGEALALAFERFREAGDDGDPEQERALRRLPNWPEVVSALDDLARDSARSRAKSDRRRQRSSFRDIVASVRHGAPAPSERVRFGAGAGAGAEELLLEDWAGRRVYEALCDVLGGGIARHLKENPALREVFGLGPPLPEPTGDRAHAGPSRHERRLANQAVAKVRETHRNQHRDKRFVF